MRRLPFLQLLDQGFYQGGIALQVFCMPKKHKEMSKYSEKYVVHLRSKTKTACDNLSARMKWGLIFHLYIWE